MPAPQRAQGARRRSKPARAAAISSPRCSPRSRPIGHTGRAGGVAAPTRPRTAAGHDNARPRLLAPMTGRPVGICWRTPRPRARCRMVRSATLDTAAHSWFHKEISRLESVPRASARYDKQTRGLAVLVRTSRMNRPAWANASAASRRDGQNQWTRRRWPRTTPVPRRRRARTRSASGRYDRHYPAVAPRVNAELSVRPTAPMRLSS
jgi:hypothetical protein